MKPSKAKAIRRAARELYDLYHGFRMPDAPSRGAVDAAWDKLGRLIGRPLAIEVNMTVDNCHKT
jgi:hypothetical protein